MTLSELVVKYRTEHKLSQRQFAQICGLSNGYISMLEKNVNPKTGLPLVPTIANLYKLALGMNMTLAQLFESVEDMPVDLGEYKMPAAGTGNGLMNEIMHVVSTLSDEQKTKVLTFAKFVAGESKRR